MLHFIGNINFFYNHRACDSLVSAHCLYPEVLDSSLMPESDYSDKFLVVSFVTTRQILQQNLKIGISRFIPKSSFTVTTCQYVICAAEKLLSWFIWRLLSVSEMYIPWTGRLMNLRRIEKDLEWNDPGLILKLSRHFPGGTESIQEIPHSE
jgi:hypothetical protein